MSFRQTIPGRLPTAPLTKDAGWISAERDTGIHKGKQRKDQVIYHRMQFVGNALQRTDRSIRQRMDIVQYLYLRRSQHGGLFRLAHLRIVQHIQIAGHITGEIVQVDLRTAGTVKATNTPAMVGEYPIPGTKSRQKNRQYNRTGYYLPASSLRHTITPTGPGKSATADRQYARYKTKR